MMVYNHPRLVPRYNPGDIVEHKFKLGVPLVIVSRLPDALDGGNRWSVRTPEGKTEPVLERNFIGG